MSDIHWFVALTRSCQERRIAQSLAAKGIETYVPVQKVRKQWSDRIKVVDKLVFPGMVFIRCSEKTRRLSFDMVYGITCFLMDKTSRTREVLVVPDRQMGDFMHVLGSLNGEEEVEIVTADIEKGDMVRIVRGPLKDFVCECVELQGKRSLVIRLDLLGAVLVTVNANDVEKA